MPPARDVKPEQTLKRFVFRPQFETLEARTLPSVTTCLPSAEHVGEQRDHDDDRTVRFGSSNECGENRFAPAATTVSNTLRAAFPAIRQSNRCDDDRDGQTIDLGLLASVQRVDIITPPAGSSSPRFSPVTAKMYGYGEGPLGDALFASLRENAARLGIKSIQWNGQKFTLERGLVATNAADFTDRLRISFRDDARVNADWFKTDFVAQVRARVDLSAQRGWPVVAIQPQGIYHDPWWIQPNVTAADITITRENVRIGNTTVNVSVATFTTRIYVGTVDSPTGAPLTLAIFLVKDKATADSVFPVETQLWQLPITPTATVNFFRTN